MSALSSYIQNSSTPLTLDVQFPTNPPPPLQMITNQSKENIIQGWLLYVIRSSLQVGFCFQYQLINLVWLSIEFFSFSWSQLRSRAVLKKLKTSFSPSSYNEKIAWGKYEQKPHYLLFPGFILFSVQLSKSISKCFLFIIIHVFSSHFAISLFYLHILKT